MSGKEGELQGRGPGKGARKSSAGDKKNNRRSTEVGRALRSVYDDTLRESVPNDFMDLLGKLS